MQIFQATCIIKKCNTSLCTYENSKKRDLNAPPLVQSHFLQTTHNSSSLLECMKELSLQEGYICVAACGLIPLCSRKLIFFRTKGLITYLWQFTDFRHDCNNSNCLIRVEYKRQKEISSEFQEPLSQIVSLHSLH